MAWPGARRGPLTPIAPEAQARRPATPGAAAMAALFPLRFTPYGGTERLLFDPQESSPGGAASGRCIGVVSPRIVFPRLASRRPFRDESVMRKMTR